MHVRHHRATGLGPATLAVLTAITLGSCGSSPTPAAAVAPSTTSTQPTTQTPSGSSTPASSSTPAATARQLDVTITGTTVSPAPATIPLGIGESLTLTVTSDHDDEVHAHGFEVEKEIKAGVPTTLVLKGALAGTYEVETHDPALTLLQIAVS